MQKIFSWI